MSVGLDLWKTIAAIAAVVVSLLGAIVTFVFSARSARAAERSAAASQKSAEAAEESVRQWRLAILPRVIAVLTPLTRGTQERMPLEVVNGGRGSAFNVQGRLNVSVRQGEASEFRDVKIVIGSLAAGERWEVAGYKSDPAHRFLGGSVVYEDVEGRRYSSRYDANAATWTFGEGGSADPDGSSS